MHASKTSKTLRLQVSNFIKEVNSPFRTMRLSSPQLLQSGPLMALSWTPLLALPSAKESCLIQSCGPFLGDTLYARACPWEEGTKVYPPCFNLGHLWRVIWAPVHPVGLAEPLMGTAHFNSSLPPILLPLCSNMLLVQISLCFPRNWSDIIIFQSN